MSAQLQSARTSHEASASPHAHLRTHDLAMTFPPRRVVWREVNLTIAPSSITAIVGANGSGKTTLLRAFAGLQTPTRGTIERSAARVSFLGQADYLYQTATVGENISLVATLCNVSPSRVQTIVNAWQIQDWWALPVATLSRGMRARVAFARAWLTSTECQLLDEPFLALDDAAVSIVQTNIETFAKNGGSVVLGLQDANACRELNPHILRITNHAIESEHLS